MRRTAPDVFVCAQVVAKHPPAGAPELDRDHRDEQHADEDMSRQQRPDVQQRRALDGEQDEQQRRDDRGQLLVAVAPAEDALRPLQHAASKARCRDAFCAAPGHLSASLVTLPA